MIKSIAIYPDIVDDAYVKKIDDYVNMKISKYAYIDI